MSYDGRVRAAAPAQVRTLDELELRKLCVGPAANNVYLLTCRRSGAQALVDPAAEPDALLALVRQGNGAARLDHLVVTHRHADHLGALASLQAVTGAQVAAGADDADAITAATDVPVTNRLVHGDVLVVGHVTLDVVGLRGHTPGSVALVYREPSAPREPQAVAGRAHVVTGDSLFPGGIGATRTPEDFATLYDDVVHRLFDTLPDDTWVYPGHGDDTTLGAERPHLRAWHDRAW